MLQALHILLQATVVTFGEYSRLLSRKLDGVYSSISNFGDNRLLGLAVRSIDIRYSIQRYLIFPPSLSDNLSLLTLFSLAWVNISVQALNTVFALFEIGFTNSPPVPWLTLPVCILVLAAYLGIAYITHATQGFYSTVFHSRVFFG